MNTQDEFQQRLNDERKVYSYFDKYYPEYLDRAEIQDILKNRTKVIKLANIIDGSTDIDGLPKDPENNEIFEYLGEFGHDFKSKHTDFLMVNEPDDFDKAVEAWQNYVKYADNDYNEREDIDTYEPIYIYYFNSISTLNSIYDGLQQVYEREVKPFKIHFPIVVRDEESLDIVKYYIESV